MLFKLSAMTDQHPLLAVKSESDLLPPGAEPGTVPTDLEQATGLERLEILGKMEGVDIFDMKPLDASRLGWLLAHTVPVLFGRKQSCLYILGTLDNPIMVNSFGDEQFAGCTGFPADSHVVLWLCVSHNLSRCSKNPALLVVYIRDFPPATITSFTIQTNLSIL